ncbi:MAG: DUF4012 domain-containing protein [Frankiales bacterium]|nr:DUF4012 domain-containing protein [Frankiales bacterium]
MRRRLVIAGVVAAVVVVLAGAWVLVRALQARSSLDEARTAIAKVRADLLAGRNADGDLAVARAKADQAKADTHDPVWFALSWLPPVHTTRGLASVADDLVRNAVTPVVRVAPTLRPTRLRVAHDRIALAPLAAAAPALNSAARAMAEARRHVLALSGGWFGPVGGARDRLLKLIDHFGGAVDNAARASRVVPTMLGAAGPRLYFVAVQNNAESRGTGGLVGSFAILRADNGRLSVVQRGSDAGLHNAKAPVVDLGADYDQVYGGYRTAALWKSSNISPDFPDAADIWTRLWQRQSGQRLDGAIGIDPVALADVLQATGPTRVKGFAQPISGANLVDVTLRQEYVLFPTRNERAQRRRFLDGVASAVINRILSGAGSAQALVRRLGDAASTGHLAIWSAHPAEEAVLAGTPIAGELPAGPGPFAALTVNNDAGGKLDYYLDRTLTYTATTCSGPRRTAHIVARLTNTAPRTGLPRYVLDRPDLPSGHETVADNKLLVLVHATQGALLQRVTLDGRPTEVTAGVERAHPVFSIVITIPPAHTSVLDFTLDERVPPGPPSTKVQPLVRRQKSELYAPTCSRS